MPNPRRHTVAKRQRKEFSAWVLRWANREDKVFKTTGTVITLLPARDSAETVRKIGEALYSAYALTYSGQAEYAQNRRAAQLSQRLFDSRIVIGDNPALIAVLARDIRVDVDDTGFNQTISWTDPDHLKPAREAPYYEVIAQGALQKFHFNYDTRVQTECD